MSDDIYKKLAKEHNLSVDEVKKACRSQFEFTRSVIEQGELTSIRLQYIGQFLVRKRKEDAQPCNSQQ